ncbi:MAG: ATP--guanido phosphotransferase, partial [Clostridia bacterium]|nr:ATP--guanido phosphotransferase [Clostridia bacterium]
MEYLVVSSRIRLARNFSGLPFPVNCSPVHADKVYTTAKRVSDKLFENDFIKIKSMSSLERNSLIESHLISPLLLESKYGALILNKERNISIMLMEEDHIRAQCMENGLSLKKCDEQLSCFDDGLSKAANIAYDYKLGYITACPSNIGTGMRASVMLFLPSVTINKLIPQIKSKVEAAGLTIRGIYGEGSEAEGCMYQISNRISLGVDE